MSRTTLPCTALRSRFWPQPGVMPASICHWAPRTSSCPVLNASAAPQLQPTSAPSLPCRCAGDKAFALESSLVGSVGVISATFGATQAATRLGIERRVYTAGDAKVQLDPFLPVTPEAVSV